MQVRILVTLDIGLLDEDISPDPTPGDPLESRMQDAALEAIKGALQVGENNGFNHDMDTITGIEITSVERAGPPTALWKCSGCGREVRLSFSELANIGNPICGAPGCGACNDEMEFVE